MTLINVGIKVGWFGIVFLMIFLMHGGGMVLAADFYVSPTGSSSGDGSIDNPWNLATAFNHPSVVQPGDTIYLRGGTYVGQFTPRLQGEEGFPIILRAYPGEHVVFDTQTPAGSSRNPNMQESSHHWWWGFEITNTRINEKGGGFILKSHKNNKFINMVIHDLGNNTFGNGDDIYGSILYNNGNYENKLGHHLYTQNPNQSSNADGSLYCALDPNGDPAIVEDSIIFQSFAFGMHAYSGGSGCLANIHMVGSVWFNNGYAGVGTGGKKDDILVGGAQNHYFIRMIDNMTWAKGTLNERTAGLGRYGTYTCDFDIIDNYLIGLTRFHNNWDDPTHCQGYSPSDVYGNVFGGVFGETFTPVYSSSFSDQNTVLTAKPTQNKIFVRPNIFESGRAHIAVYNWEDLDVVEIDVSHILEWGDVYEVRNGQNFFAEPVLSGVYSGEELALPMDAGFNPAQPISPGEITDAEKTGREFNVFVLMPPLEGGQLTPTPTQSPPGLMGDINGDGKVNLFDYNLLIAAMGTANAAADLNADGVVDILDYGILMDNFGG